MPPDFGLHYKVIVIRTVWYWHKSRHIDKWNKTASPELSLHTCGQLICDGGGKNIKWREDNVFSTWCWENWTAACKRQN